MIYHVEDFHRQYHEMIQITKNPNQKIQIFLETKVSVEKYQGFRKSCHIFTFRWLKGLKTVFATDNKPIENNFCRRYLIVHS